MCDYGGAVCTAFILGPHRDAIGRVGKCQLFMDIASKMMSMICLGLMRMFSCPVPIIQGNAHYTLESQGHYASTCTKVGKFL